MSSNRRPVRDSARSLQFDTLPTGWYSIRVPRTTATRPSLRVPILQACQELLRSRETLSLESAARAAGLSKPGLMYHFPTKEALLAALVDYLIDGYEEALRTLLAEHYPDQVHDPAGPDAQAASGAAHQEARLGSYVRWCLTAEHDAADLVMLTDPNLRAPMTERWVQRLRPWLELPAGLSPKHRARLHAARLIAEGAWWADATGIMPVAPPDRPDLLATALTLMEGPHQ